MCLPNTLGKVFMNFGTIEHGIRKCVHEYYSFISWIVK